MMDQWANIELEIIPYRDTGTSVLKGLDEIQAVLDEHITMTQAMQFSSFKKPFEDQILVEKINSALSRIEDEPEP